MNKHENYSINKEELLSQRWFYYVAMTGWLAYMLILPWMWQWHPLAAIIAIIFSGVYFYTWIAFLMHESWHHYVPGVPHKVFYTLFSWFILTDPQLYRIIHGVHHSQVNSWDDIEFYPFGYIRNKTLLRIWSILEITLGETAMFLAYVFILPRNPVFSKKFRLRFFLLTVLALISYLFGMGMLSLLIFGVEISSIVFSYISTFWFCSVVLHHSQLIEHGNVIIDGDFEKRSTATRNLPPSGWMEKFFLFLTHNDSREHVLHHTHVALHSRPYPNRIPLPENAISFRLRDYPRLIMDILFGDK